jgi:hypothetical protein
VPTEELLSHFRIDVLPGREAADKRVGQVPGAVRARPAESACSRISPESTTFNGWRGAVGCRDPNGRV